MCVCVCVRVCVCVKCTCKTWKCKCKCQSNNVNANVNANVYAYSIYMNVSYSVFPYKYIILFRKNVSGMRAWLRKENMFPPQHEHASEYQHAADLQVRTSQPSPRGCSHHCT